MRKLRLLLFENCEKRCVGCCNKDWDLSNLPVVKDYTGYDVISLTGREPMLDPYLVIRVATDITNNSEALVYLYTAKSKPISTFITLVYCVDGICLTLHEQKDVGPFIELNEQLDKEPYNKKSLRLNIFKGIELGLCDLSKWKVKKDIEWIKNCPLPKDEVFMRL